MEYLVHMMWCTVCTGYEKEEGEGERYLVVRAGQAGTTLQHVDLAQKDQHLAPGANFQVHVFSLYFCSF